MSDTDEVRPTNSPVSWEDDSPPVLLEEELVVQEEPQTAQAGGLGLRVHVGGEVLLETSQSFSVDRISRGEVFQLPQRTTEVLGDLLLVNWGSWDRRADRRDGHNIRPEEARERSEPDVD